MKGAAEFALDLLVTAPAGTRAAGQLVTNPSTSPENNYLVDGKGQSLTFAATMDLQLVGELFERCRKAAAILGVDADFAKTTRAGRLAPAATAGRRARTAAGVDRGLRRSGARPIVTSRTCYALYPGQGIDVERTPALAAAARRSLELRGDGGTGWAAAWRVALWARLGDGDRAYANLRFLLTKSTLPNMFDLHPPFQIDGNLGGTAGITELLVQSTADEIRLLPALPKRWTTGHLAGVRVRGGATVDVSWKDGQLTEARVRSDRASALQGQLQRTGGRRGARGRNASRARFDAAPGRAVDLVGASRDATEEGLDDDEHATFIGRGGAGRRVLAARLGCAGADRGAARGPGREARRGRAHQDPRHVARGQPRGRRRRPRRPRLPAAELRQGDEAPVPGRLRPARLLDRRGAVGAGDPRAADDRRRVRAGRPRDDRRAARLEDRAQRVDVLELGHDRRLRALRLRGRRHVHRRALPDAAEPEEPRARRALDGRVRRDADRHEARRRVRRPLHHEPVLPVGPAAAGLPMRISKRQCRR